MGFAPSTLGAIWTIRSRISDDLPDRQGDRPLVPLQHPLAEKADGLDIEDELTRPEGRLVPGDLADPEEVGGLAGEPA
jgi:hypothetical protein